MSGRRVRHWLALGACALAALLAAAELSAQEVRVRDLIIPDAAPPVRLMGYGLVTGLNNTGDRVTGAAGSRQTVQSVVNLLRRFDVEVTWRNGTRTTLKQWPASFQSRGPRLAFWTANPDTGAVMAVETEQRELQVAKCVMVPKEVTYTQYANGYGNGCCGRR